SFEGQFDGSWRRIEAGTVDSSPAVMWRQDTLEIVAIKEKKSSGFFGSLPFVPTRLVQRISTDGASVQRITTPSDPAPPGQLLTEPPSVCVPQSNLLNVFATSGTFFSTQTSAAAHLRHGINSRRALRAAQTGSRRRVR